MLWRLILLFPIITSCAQWVKPHQDCLESDKHCLQKAAKNHPIQKASFWQEMQSLPPEERLAMAPPEMIDYVWLQNRLQGFSEVPRAIEKDPAFMADFKQALKDLPPLVKAALSKKLLGIYLMQDTGGSAMTDMIKVNKETLLGSFMIFDQNRLMKKANEWATWKEASVFRAHPDWKVELIIAQGKDNTRARAISFILLHELGHVIAAGEDFHPPWDGTKDPLFKHYPYTQIDWPHFTSFHQPEFSSKYDHTTFPLRSQIAFYTSSSKLGEQQIKEIYQQLATTSFPSLYGATQPGDDFAESFAIYVHHILLKRPYRVSVRHKGNEVQFFESCLQTGKCEEKRRILDAYFQRFAH